MAESRIRQRVSSAGTGTGERERGGAGFEFRLTDFSVAGLMLEITEGEPPELGDRVRLAFSPPRLDGFETPIRAKGTVRRRLRHAGFDRCGVELDAVRSPDDGDALDEAYLEHVLLEDS